MRTGVILLIQSPSESTDRLEANLQAKGIPVLECSPDEVDEEPETTADFIAENRLETLVVSNFTGAAPSDSLRHAVEDARLGHLAVSWIDLVPLFGEQPSEVGANAANMIFLNVARLQRADLIRNAVPRTVPRSSKISRRELFRSVPRILRVESNIPIVLADRCKDRSKTCDYCIKACPVSAISQALEAVTINDRLCIECGACARDCPIGAIQSPSVSDAQMIAMLNTLSSEEPEPRRQALMVTCSIGFEKLLDESRKGKRLDAGITPVQIPCVSSIASAHYLWAASLGVALVTVCPDTSCPKAVGMFPMFRHASSSKAILKALGEDKATSVYHFALSSNDSVTDSVSPIAESASPVNVSAKFSGVFRHERTVDAITALAKGKSGITEVPEGITLPFFDLKVDGSRCVFCELCKRDCPDNAIDFTKSQDDVTLMFDPSSCGGCMICGRACPEKAIKIAGLDEFSPVLERKKMAKARDENAKCVECGAVLGSRRSIAVLKKRLSRGGVSDAAVKALDLCLRCKQNALIRPLGQHLQT